MKILEKLRILEKSVSCYPVATEAYEVLASAIRPDRRFVWSDVDERHVIVVDDAWNPVWVWYVEELSAT